MRSILNVVMLSCLVLVGCRTVPVQLNVLKPALVDMNRYQHVVVERVDGEIGVSVADDVQSILAQQGRFTVHAREDLLTRRMPVGSALITGSVRASYEENINESETTCYDNGRSYKCIQYTRVGNLTVDGSMRVTDVATGQRAGEVGVSCSRSQQTSDTRRSPPRIDSNNMAYDCASEVAGDFVTSLAPYRVTETLLFRKNGSFPHFLEGVEKARAADLKGAILIFQNDLDQAKDLEPSDKAEAWWNIGLAYEYDDQFDNALMAFRKAREQDPSEEMYAREFEKVEQRRGDVKELVRQGAPVAIGPYPAKAATKA